jgi:hypothetical protein
MNQEIEIEHLEAPEESLINARDFFFSRSEFVFTAL